jgi:hypothetical protein
MLVRARTPRIDVRISGRGARKVAGLIQRAYKDVRVEREDDDELVNLLETDWYKNMSAKMTPAKILGIYRDNAGLTLTQVSDKTGIAVSHLSAMENGSRGIGRISAQKLGKALKCEYRHFL